MHITVLGTGYVGLVSGACLAERGHDVVCVDIDEEKIAALNAGKCPIYEDGLPEILRRNVGERLSFVSDLESSITKSAVVMICVGTPFNGDSIDLSFLKAACGQIGEIIGRLSERKTIIVKSTVIPGTTQTVVSKVIEESSGKKVSVDFGLGMNPEFLKEGSAVKDFMDPDRIVVGAVDRETTQLMKGIYLPFEGVDVLEVSCTTAELIKYASNSLLATLISFSNELGNLCASHIDVDAIDVFDGVHLDRRLTPILRNSRIWPELTGYLKPGCGFGGSCFPKDVKSLIADASARNIEMPLLKSVISVNEHQPEKMIELLRGRLPHLEGKKIGVLGLAFKPGTDDLRESPSLKVIDKLLAEKALVLMHDPVALNAALANLGDPNVFPYSDLDDLIKDADALLVMTAWESYKNLAQLMQVLDRSVPVIDGRRILNKHEFENYAGIGLSE